MFNELIEDGLIERHYTPSSVGSIGVNTFYSLTEGYIIERSENKYKEYNYIRHYLGLKNKVLLSDLTIGELLT